MASSKDRKHPYVDYASPTQTGKIPFTPPGTELQCETAYWLWGDLARSKTPPLIVLHGGPGAPGRDFNPLAAYLNDNYGIPVLLYDQIGCGASTHLRDRRGDVEFWSDDLFFAELENVKTHLQINTFDLMGHSCGGMLTAMYMLKQPPHLRKVIIASAPASDEQRREGFLQTRRALPQRTQDVLALCEKEGRTDAPEYRKALDEVDKRFCRMNPWPPELRECVALMDEDDTVGHTMYGDVPGETAGPRKYYDVRGRLGEVTDKTVPGGVLLTLGQYDIFSEEAMDPFATQIRAKVQRRTFEQSAHFPHIEELEDYATTVAGFLTT
ncbi:proline-specific peptidase [Neohortaea acidophila]|uniref:Proline-specific peptidase n=1 Tax=Neohortaea acidophila TaxID=245834 RepID=A0A6A6PMP6_9PEZI|nr:proline-specific peptidase [Neohortaea acidophila]KAF2480961.1 proline-specific peptidase [Neohortaea acidophila]